MSTGFASLENVPIELEASERSRSSSQASGRQTQRSVLDTEHGSITDAGSSTRKDKENLERLLNIFNGGNGLNMGVSSSLGHRFFYFLFYQIFLQQVYRVGGRNKNKNKIHSDHFPIELKSKETRFMFPSILIQLENGPNEFYF